MAASTDPVEPDGGDGLVRPGPPLRWPERIGALADATGTTPGRLAGGAALAVLAVLVGLWVTRPPADPVETALPFASTTEVPASTAPRAAAVVVHVAGAVAHPGVLELPAGSRVVDAVDGAGGLTPEADGLRLNLAALVGDGERVYVPAVGEPDPPSPAGGAPSGSAAPAGPININSADAAALETLPGVGPATAAAIVEHRERIGRFSSVDQLLDVRGIGEAKLEAMRDLVRT